MCKKVASAGVRRESVGSADGAHVVHVHVHPYVCLATSERTASCRAGIVAKSLFLYGVYFSRMRYERL